METPREHASRNALKQEVTRIWCAVLGVDAVGEHDSFLELGGDSVMAQRIVNRIWERFEVDVSVRVLFEQPTVAGLCDAIAVAQDGRVGERA